ncbi:hypothetical protein [Gemmiger sp.]
MMQNHKNQARRALWALGIAAAVLVLCSKSSPLFVLNDWMDANIFFTMGKSMFGGKVLYRDVFDHKGPVLYFLYGLASLLDRTGFTGVLVLETAAFALFLALSLRTAETLLGRQLHPAWTVLPAAGIAASRAFAHGGSAEELLLPFLAAALYGAVKTLQSSRPMPLRTVVLHGFLAGCALWLKYTVLGFYLVWAALLAVTYLRRGQAARLGKSIAAYLGGMALATLPWVVYFGVHGALGDWFTAYFYDNLFLYKGEDSGAPALAQHLWWAVRDALPAAVLLAMFLLWAVCRRRFAAAVSVAALAAGLAFTSLMGGYLVYYGLVLAVFAPLGLVPLAALWGTRKNCALVWLAAGAAWCFAFSPNRALRFRSADTMPQIRFAKEINGGTLLNYGTLDGGFYTAAGVLPPCRYFCVTNMPLDDQWADQQAVLAACKVEYVAALTGDLSGDFPQYKVVDQCSYDGGEGEVTWYLYRLQA